MRRKRPKARGRYRRRKTYFLFRDLALVEDPSYLALVNEYANDVTALDIDFTNAWYSHFLL